MIFSERMKEVVAQASHLAVRTGGLICTEHLLYGLTVVESEYASMLLREYGVTPDYVLGAFTSMPVRSTVEYSARARKALDYSSELAWQFYHDEILPEHLLLAVLADKSGVAAKIVGSKVDLNGAVADLCYVLQGGRGVFGDYRNDEPDFNKDEIVDEFIRFTYGASSEEDLRRRSKIVDDDYNSRNRVACDEGGRKNKETEINLSDFGTDLTDKARKGKLDPVVGREKEIERVIGILCRRTKNNPVLIGEPGVGKSAVIDGLAEAIVSGDVPDMLKDKIVFSLDVTSMVAGTRYRGDFEERMKNALKAIRDSGNVILFIDEIHTILKAGSAEGGLDVANILKPMLARGELQTVGATTIAEYRKYFEKDPALERRFQPVTVEQPSVSDTIEILRGLREKYQLHHKVEITDEAISASAILADRYVTDRFFPDKAIDLVDEASSRAKMAGKTSIGENEIAEIVSDWTGIPVTKINEEESEKLNRLESVLASRVVGQKEAVAAVANAIRRARVGLKDPKRPVGSFMFIGPTGVGKTELCKALAEALFGDENMLIRVDMSEYMDKQNVSRLIGSAPGLVGYEDGGQLTEKVRRKPYSVVLFDEVEKAHPDVYNILLQILDDGRLTDGQGRTVNFKNTIVIMTSNLGADERGESSRSLGFNSANRDEDAKEKQMKALKNAMKPELINRIDEIIDFHPLSRADIVEICGAMLRALAKRLSEINVMLHVSVQAQNFIAEKNYSEEYGARPIRRAIRKSVEDKLSEMMLDGRLSEGDDVYVDCDGFELTFRTRQNK